MGKGMEEEFEARKSELHALLIKVVIGYYYRKTKGLSDTKTYRAASLLTRHQTDLT